MQGGGMMRGISREYMDDEEFAARLRAGDAALASLLRQKTRHDRRERFIGRLYWTVRRVKCAIFGHQPETFSEQGGPHEMCGRCAKTLN